MMSAPFTPDQEARLGQILDYRLKSSRHENGDHLDRGLLPGKINPANANAVAPVTGQSLQVDSTGSASWNSARFCKVYNTDANIIPALAAVTPTKIPFNQEQSDVYGLHDNVTNNTRIRLDRAGVWLCGFTALYGSFTTYAEGTDLYGWIYFNNAASFGSQDWRVVEASGGIAQQPMMQVGGVPIVCTTPATDYVEAVIYSDQGTSIIGSDINHNNFWALFMGAL